ncbi:MAG TPA: uracil-DNA glycosylase [Pyrinomonadaceae bacterium]|nr:uracil-DNA glycosylase [Pyrinomonadaceae bacterium]
MTNEINELISDVREQVLYLQELGVESFDVSLSEHLLKFAGHSHISNLRSQISEPRAERIVNAESHEIPQMPRPEIKTTERPPAGSRLSSLPTLSTRKKTVPFFDKYNPEERPETGDKRQETQTSVPAFDTLLGLPEATETIEQIRAEIGKDCRRCKLCDLGRTQVVNSVGNFNADLMFVGEAPGADEDAQGEPFVGKAGQLLTDIIEKGLQIPRKDVFIGNINRCRPPGNRAPEPDESVVCKPFLQREIAVVRPKVIVVLGATAAQNLLETKVPISKLRGRFHDYLGTKVMPTFHPAYLLRDPHKKREVWEDMKMVKSYLTATGG